MGKGTVSAMDLLGGFPDTCEMVSGFYGINDHAYPLGWRGEKRRDKECHCCMCEKKAKKKKKKKKKAKNK